MTWLVAAQSKEVRGVSQQEHVLIAVSSPAHTGLPVCYYHAHNMSSMYACHALAPALDAMQGLPDTHAARTTKHMHTQPDGLWNAQTPETYIQYIC